MRCLMGALLVVFMAAAEATAQSNPTVVSDSVGYSYYDFITNGSSKRNIENYEDGTAVLCRVASLVADPAFPDRGPYWGYYDGGAWTEDWLRISDVRAGGPAGLGRFPSQKQFVVYGSPTRIVVQNAPHTYDWTTRTIGSAALWPTAAADDAGYVHIVGSAQGSFSASAIRYTRLSVDGSVNDWTDVNLWTLTGADTLLDPREADAYDVDARANTVVAVQAVEDYGYLVMFTSTDNGVNWAHQIIESPPISFPSEAAFIDPYLAIDASGNPHVFWTTLTADGLGNFGYSGANSIRHWSALTGETIVIELPDILPDWQSLINRHMPINPGANAGFFATPSAGTDANGVLYVAFTCAHSTADTSMDPNNRGAYNHIFLATSEDGGLTWSSPLDINAGVTGRDFMWANMARRVGNPTNPNRAGWLIANADALPGNNVQNASHQFTRSAVMAYTFEPVIVDVPNHNHRRVYRLLQNHPNPFNPSTTISFETGRAGYAELTVYNILGERIRTLHSGELTAGVHSVTWDGKDALGRAVASGIYLYRLEAGGVSVTRKMTVIR